MVIVSQTQTDSARTMTELNVNHDLNPNPPPIPPRTYTPLTQDIRLKITHWVNDFYHPIPIPNELNSNNSNHPFSINLQRVSLHLEQSPLRQRRLAAKRPTPLMITNKSFGTYRKPRLVLKPASRPRPIR